MVEDVRFDSLTNILDQEMEDETVVALTETIKNMNIPESDIVVIAVEKPEPKRVENLLDPTIRAAIMEEPAVPENNIFSKLITTTITAEGFLSNLDTHERELIYIIPPDENIVRLKSNYGDVCHESYHEPVKIKKTNRGRKKRDKKKKQRKIQGDGSCFNSQLTFFVKSQVGTPELADRIYKVKIFRKGTIQIPGLKPEVIEDIILCVEKIVEAINIHVHSLSITPITKLINISPVMKNYKFTVRIKQYQFVHLAELNRLVSVIHPDAPEHPRIVYVKCTRQDSKLSIKFATPLPNKSGKMIRINIFPSGKINILGAHDEHITCQIYDYMYWIFENFPSVIANYPTTEIIRKGIVVENIALVESDEEIAQHIARMKVYEPICTLSSEDLREVEKILSDI